MAQVNGHANGNTNGMNSTNASNSPDCHASTPSRLYKTNGLDILTRLKSLCEPTYDLSQHYKHATSISRNIPIYDLSQHDLNNPEELSTLQDEWHSTLHLHSGVLVLKNCYAFSQHSIIDATNRAFDRIIKREEASTTGRKGDHFAASNANSRIWNSLQKHAFTDPSSFVPYYANPWLHHISHAWLGPGYTLTAQVNIVRPGGKPQMPHRDYHLGFQTESEAAHWPATMHQVSQFLTLQGAVAHSDMPLESGPTRFLPFSQLLPEGYLAWRREDVKEYFTEKWVSLPLEKGDAVFFNPALIHAAGENATTPGRNGVDRSANLLQISSAFGKTMERIDFEGIVVAVWEELKGHFESGKLGVVEAECVVRAMTDGYPFPTNLDRRPPATGGMAPEGMTNVVLRALKEGCGKAEVEELLRQYREDSSA